MNFGVLFTEILKASGTTLGIFFLTLLFSLPLGLLLAFGRRSRHVWINAPVRLYILIMRGTPLMLQLMFIFYGLNTPLSRFDACIVGFSLNYAAYFAEIYRGGIEGVPVGQHEASRVLGFSKWQTYRRIILPQVLKRILPPMGNEFITLVKDTSLAQTIVVMEIMYVTQKFASSAVSAVPFAVAALFYLAMNGIVTFCFDRAERRLAYYH